uniref:Uncharacterized protein n=1 Tax=Heterorhabditis bacteriophora TaxID=37862 RepID=A0A1I7WHK1_HETBA
MNIFCPIPSETILFNIAVILHNSNFNY